MNVASYIDYTILKPDCTIDDIKEVCKEAMEHEVKAVCIPPFYIRDAARLLKDSPTKVVTVIGFPMGYSATPAKVEEIKRAVNDEIDEVEVVVNINAVKKGDWAHVKNDIDSTTLAAHSKGKIIKLIFETSLLTQEEIKQLCEIVEEKGVDYVRISTGMQEENESLEMIQFLRQHLSAKIKIKASVTTGSVEDIRKMIEAGADRIGCSSVIAIASNA